MIQSVRWLSPLVQAGMLRTLAPVLGHVGLGQARRWPSAVRADLRCGQGALYVAALGWRSGAADRHGADHGDTGRACMHQRQTRAGAVAQRQCHGHA